MSKKKNSLVVLALVTSFDFTEKAKLEDNLLLKESLLRSADIANSLSIKLSKLNDLELTQLNVFELSEHKKLVHERFTRNANALKTITSSLNNSKLRNVSQ